MHYIFDLHTTLNIKLRHSQRDRDLTGKNAVIEDVNRDNHRMLGCCNESRMIVDAKVVLEPENSGAIPATFGIVGLGLEFRRERK